MQKVVSLDVYNDKNEYIGKKRFYATEHNKKINEYLQEFDDKQCQKLAILMADAPDFQNNNHVAIMTSKTKGHWIFKNITPNNLIPFSVYFAVRHAIKATWLNDRDQFLYPRPRESSPVIVSEIESIPCHSERSEESKNTESKKILKDSSPFCQKAQNDEATSLPPTWEEDSEFQNDCLAFTLFHSQNRITSRVDSTNGGGGVNHCIPFSEKEVEAKEAFASHFMHDFINGRIKQDCFTSYEVRNDDSSPVIMSERESSPCHSASHSVIASESKQSKNTESTITDSVIARRSRSNLAYHCDTSSHHCNQPYRHSEALAEESKSIETKKDISHSLNMTESTTVIASERESTPCHSERSEESKNTESKKILKDSSPFDKKAQNDKVGFSGFTKAHNDKKDSSFVSSAHNDSTSTLFSDTDLGLESKSFIPTKPLVFSKEAQDVFEAGLKIWQYYHKNFEKIPEIHAQHNDDFYRIYNANASLYDIKGYFQGFTQSRNKNKMNARSQDSHYNDLIAELRYALEILAKKIEPQIYAYGFLLE